MLRVTDDGIGIEPTAGRGNGLNNMQARADRHGGRLTVSRPDRGGTMLEWTVPLNRDAR